MSQAELRPAKNIVILKDPPVQTTESGLEFSNLSGNKKPELGVVVSVGSGKKPCEFKEGDLIYYERYLDNRIPFGSDLYNFVRFDKILAVKPAGKND